MVRQRTLPGDPSKGEIRLVEQRLVYENSFVRVFNDRVEFPQRPGGTGNPQGDFLRIAYGTERPNGVVVVPITETDGIVLVRQFRHSPRIWMEELPRGFGEVSENNRITMFRELLSETGFVVDWSEQYPLGRVVTDSGKLQDIPHLLITRAKRKAGVGPDPEESEAISGHVEYSYTELRRKCQSGELLDLFTIAAVTRLEPHFVGNQFCFNQRFAKQSPTLNALNDFSREP